VACINAITDPVSTTLTSLLHTVIVLRIAPRDRGVLPHFGDRSGRRLLRALDLGQPVATVGLDADTSLRNASNS
jgi:hypothetical protein